MSKNELSIENLARLVAEFRRRMEAIAPVVETCVVALVSPMSESDARVLRARAQTLLNGGQLTDEQTAFCERLANAEDIGMLAGPLAWEAIDQIQREIGLR